MKFQEHSTVLNQSGRQSICRVPPANIREIGPLGVERGFERAIKVRRNHGTVSQFANAHKRQVRGERLRQALLEGGVEPAFKNHPA